MRTQFTAQGLDRVFLLDLDSRRLGGLGGSSAAAASSGSAPAVARPGRRLDLAQPGRLRALGGSAGQRSPVRRLGDLGSSSSMRSARRRPAARGARASIFLVLAILGASVRRAGRAAHRPPPGRSRSGSRTRSLFLMDGASRGRVGLAEHLEHELGESDVQAGHDGDHHHDEDDHHDGVGDQLVPRWPRTLRSSEMISRRNRPCARRARRSRSAPRVPRCESASHALLSDAADLRQRAIRFHPAARPDAPRPQGRQDSNLQPPVLETGALPIEPRPYTQRTSDLAGGHHSAHADARPRWTPV